jgi:3-phosphoshikimate 1-carboxyvinyltransferase
MAMNDDLRVPGVAPLRGRIRVPGDKGISHRALLFAAMADGRSRLVGLAGGDDVWRTRRALAQLGTSFSVAGSAVTVESLGIDALVEPESIVDCGNSGTSIRALTGLLAGRSFLTVLAGDESLLQRPMRRVVEPLRAMGAHIDGRRDGALAPLAVRGGDLEGRSHRLAVASAQVKTALVLAGLQAHGTTEVSEPFPSRDHTERMLGALEAPIERVDATTVRVTHGMLPAFELAVPGDPSSASFWVVGAVVTPGSDVVLEGVGCNPSRLAFVDVLRRMGAVIEIELTGEVLGEPVGDIHVVAGSLVSTTIRGAEIPLVQDEVPVLAVAAAFADGVTEIHDASELRVKESDRVATVQQLVHELGVRVEAAGDTLAISGGRPRAGRFHGHGDHRIAMAAAIAANATEGESVIEGWRVAGVSYPEFSDDLALLTGHERA